MYAGVAAFTKMISTVSSPLRVVDRDGLHGYVFSTIDHHDGRHPVVAVAWSSSEKARRLTIDPAATAFDLMGNTIGEHTIELTETPVYLVAHEPEPVLRTLANGRSEAHREPGPGSVGPGVRSLKIERVANRTISHLDPRCPERHRSRRRWRGRTARPAFGWGLTW